MLEKARFLSLSEVYLPCLMKPLALAILALITLSHSLPNLSLTLSRPPSTRISTSASDAFVLVDRRRRRRASSLHSTYSPAYSLLIPRGGSSSSSDDDLGSGSDGEGEDDEVAKLFESDDEDSVDDEEVRSRERDAEGR